MLVIATLDPYGVSHTLPAREHADAVSARSDLVEVGKQRLPGNLLEDLLAHLVGRLELERDSRDGAERTEPDDGAVKPASPRVSETTSPDEVTRSSAVTAVARLPFRRPEPWVAVAIDPATEMWGSEARFASAHPSRWSAIARSV